MVRRFSIRPAITVSGRSFKGLRGWAGKPSHPPLTDIPIAAYVLVAVFDVISVIAGDGHGAGRDLWRAGTYVVVGGAAVAVLAAVTGFVDWLRSTDKGTQVRRTANTHAAIMVSVTVLVVVEVVLRLSRFDADASTPVGVVVLSLVIALLVVWGATYGGSLVFDYGFNVETATDSPVWHPSEADVLPGQKGEGA
jgi:uncharacterized membrane protein